MERRRLWGCFTAAFQYLRRAYKKEVEGLFIEINRSRTKGNDFKLKKTAFRLTIRQKFCIVRVVRH